MFNGPVFTVLLQSSTDLSIYYANITYVFQLEWLPAVWRRGKCFGQCTASPTTVDKTQVGILILECVTFIHIDIHVYLVKPFRHILTIHKHMKPCVYLLLMALVCHVCHLATDYIVIFPCEVSFLSTQ